MTKITKIILLVIAVLLIVGGIAAAVFVLVSDNGADNNDDSVADETTVRLHDDVEYIYNENGDVKSEIYYKDDVYIGRKDFFKSGKYEYVTVLDADSNETYSSITELNLAGSISLVTVYENKELSKTVEYVYYDDMRTLAKKTTKTFDGDDEFAEKIYYSESGVKTRVCRFENGTVTEDTYYDENGKVIENGGETVEE